MKKLLLFPLFTLIALGLSAQCSVTNVFPACTDFSVSGGVPSCWVDAGQDPWIIAGTWPFYGAGGQVNSGFIGVDASDPNNGVAQLISESYDLSAGIWPTPPQLAFDIFSDNIDNPGDNALVTVEVSTDGGGSWATLLTYQADSVSILELTADLSGYIADTVVFRFNVDYSVMTGFQFYNDILINNVCIKQTASCVSPYFLGAFNFSTSSASLYWTENGTATLWDIELGIAGFTPTGNPTPGYNDLTNDTVVVGGLNSATSYDFYVRSDCGPDTSIWVGPFTFTTNPDYCAGDLFLDSGGATGAYGQNESATYVICPDTPGEVVGVDFSMVSIFGAPTDFMQVYNGAGTGGDLLEGNLQAPESFTSYASDGCLTFTWISDGFLELAGWSATVTCAPQAPCVPPDSMSLDAVIALPDTVNLSWTSTGWGNTYVVEYRAVGSSTWIAAPGNPYSTNSAQLTGLSTNDYEWRVASICAGPSNSTSAFVEGTFTTIPFIGTCADAMSIGPGSFTVLSINNGNGAANNCGGSATHASWYTYTPSISGVASIESFSGGDTYVAVYGGDCNALNCINFDDNSGQGMLSLVTFSICAGITYYIEWTDQSGFSGPINFTLSEQLNCNPPVGLNANGVTPYAIQGLNWAGGSGACSGGLGFEYELVLAGDQAFAGNAVQTGLGSYPLTTLNIMGLSPNTSYEFWLRDICSGGGTSDSIGGLWTTLATPPANDTCYNAIPVFAGYTVTGFSSQAATGTDITSCTPGDNASVWFAYTAPCNDTIQVNTCGSSFDTNISIFADCSGTTELACNNDVGTNGPCAMSLQSIVEIPVIAGETYYIRIAGSNGATGDINFTILEMGGCPCTSNIWTSANSTSWNDPNNWSCNIVPSNNCSSPPDDIIIPIGSALTPVIFGTQSARNVELYPGTSIQINGTLQVCGNVIHNGAALTGVGNFELVGPSVQTLEGNGTFAFIELNNTNGAVALPTANLQVDSGLILSEGIFTNNGSMSLNARLHTAAYLDDFTGLGVYDGDITVNRYVSEVFSSGTGQAYIGSAVDASILTGLDSTYAAFPAGGYVMPIGCDPIIVDPASPYSNLFQWDEDAIFPTSCVQEGWFALDADVSLLSPSRGYKGWMRSGEVVSVTGNPNSGVQTYLTTNSSSNSTSARGYHVLSNPYPSPMHLDAVTIASGLHSPQYYNAGMGPWSGTYQPALIAGNEIPAMHGFIAYSDGLDTFVTDDTYRIASTTVNSNPINNWYDYKLNIEVTVGGTADISYLYYSNSTTDQFDVQGDCEKRESDVGKPTLYTRSQGLKMSLNGLNINDLGISVPMGLITPVNGPASFSFSGMSQFPNNVIIYLEDKVEGVLHNMQHGPYLFNADLAENGTDRFEIHFSMPAYFNLIEPTCAFNQAILEELSNDGRTMTISDAGVLVQTTVLDGSQNILPPGDYEIEVFDSFGASQLYAFIIEEVPPVQANINTSSTNVDVGQSVDFDCVSSSATSFQWFVNGQLISQSAMFNYQFDIVGQYIVELIASNGICETSVFDTILVQDVSSAIVTINEEIISIAVLDGNLVVDLVKVESGQITIAVYNLLGQEIAKQSVQAGLIHTVNSKLWAEGYYFVQVQQNEHTITQTILILKE